MPTIEVPALTQLDIEKVFKPFPDSKPWRDGALRGAIKTKDGTKYHVKETLLNQFRDGETCQVEVKTFGGKDGKEPGREIVKRVGQPPIATPKQYTRPATDKGDAEHIFVNGKMAPVTAMFIDENLRLNEAAFSELGVALRRCFARIFGGATRQRDEAMNDEISF